MTPGEWAQLLYGDATGPLSVFSKSTSGVTRVVWTSPDAIDADVAKLDGDVWLGCATRRERLANGRGGDADCLEVPGLWLDVDVAGPHHAAANLPMSIAEAADLIRAFPLRPTVVINSGGGLQAWWLFSELVDAVDAKPVLDRWAVTWKELGRRRGWHVDNVFDLARIMRLPGTANHKSDPPCPVDIAFIRPDRRYGLDDFEPYMLEVPPAPVAEREPYIGPARAGDRYNAVTDPGAILLGRGCVFDHETNGERHYRAPHHAVDNTTGVVVYPDGHTTIYSETWAQTTGLEVRRPYDPFGLLTVLEHRGDYEAAARSLDPTFGELPRVVDSEASSDAEVAPADADGRLRLLTLEGLRLRPVHWLWDQRIPVGQITLLAGREGIGKSTVALSLAAKVTRGTLEGASFGRPRDVVIVATEDSFEHTIGPRLVAHDADLGRVFRVEMTHEYAALAFPGDLPELEAACAARDVALIILDPLLSRLSAKLDTHVDSQTRQALEPLGAFADRSEAAVLGLIHVNKSRSTDPLDAIMASRAFTAFARAVLFALRDPADDASHLLGLVKSNLGKTDLDTLTYGLESVVVAETDEGSVSTARVAWGEPTSRTIREVLETEPGKQSKIELAAEWLRGWLCEHGQVPVSAVKTAAAKVVDDAGEPAPHSWSTVKKARGRAGAIYEKVGMPAVVYWRLKHQLPGEPCGADS